MRQCRLHRVSLHGWLSEARNKNTNGLLRQYLSKSADLSQATQHEFDAIARSLNTRPLETLGWMTPSAVLAKAVATTG